MKALIYARVSTSKQDTKRQVNDLKSIASSKGWEVVSIHTEKITGKSKAESRTEFAKALKLIKSVDVVLFHELSRLGRDARDIQKTVDLITKENNKGLYIHTPNIELLPNNDSTKQLMSRLFIDILANLAEIEITQLKDRIHSGLQVAKSNGKTLGRPIGTTKTPKQILSKPKYKRTVQLIKEGYSLRNINSITGISIATIRKLKTALKEIA